MTREDALAVLVVGVFSLLVVSIVVAVVLHVRLATHMKREHPSNWEEVRDSWLFWPLLSRKVVSLNDPTALLLFSRFGWSMNVWALVTLCWLVTMVLILVP